MFILLQFMWIFFLLLLFEAFVWYASAMCNAVRVHRTLQKKQQHFHNLHLLFVLCTYERLFMKINTYVERKAMERKSILKFSAVVCIFLWNVTVITLKLYWTLFNRTREKKKSNLFCLHVIWSSFWNAFVCYSYTGAHLHLRERANFENRAHINNYQ